MKALILIALAVILAGCTLKLTFVEFTQEGTNEGQGESTAATPSKVTNVMGFITPGASFSTKTDQTTDGQVPISLYGANSATGNQTKPQGTYSPLEVIERVVGAAEAFQTEAPPTIKKPDAVESVAPVYSSVEVVKLRPIDNKSFEWLPETGKAYGKNILFTFDNDCGSLLVPDGSVSHTPNGNINDHNQIVYFCGTDFPVGAAENNQGRASIFTAPGCVATQVSIQRQ